MTLHEPEGHAPVLASNSVAGLIAKPSNQTMWQATWPRAQGKATCWPQPQGTWPQSQEPYDSPKYHPSSPKQNMQDQPPTNCRNIGMVGKFEEINSTLHYNQGKNDSIYYAYDIFSSLSYHKKLSTKSCRALIFNGDHDLTFPYVGVEQWIASLNLEVEEPWKPFYVDNQVGGYVTKYALNNYSLTHATVKCMVHKECSNAIQEAGHVVEIYKPKESFVLLQRWFSSQAHSSDT
ncbi:hypothetical protein R6Q59_007432 [Mikania micrantha]